MNILDKIISYIDPQLALKRAVYRTRYEQYAAAKTTRLTGDWRALNTNVNELVKNSAPNVRARVRQLVRDFPYFSNAVNIIVDYTVGQGIVFQSKVHKVNGDLDQKNIDRIEYAFRAWMDDCDIAGRLHYYEMQRLAKKQDVESGEFIVVKRQVKKQLKLQMLESDWLDVNKNEKDKKLTVDQGVEYDYNSGRPVAYHFVDPDGWGKTMRIPAESVIHGFDTLRPGQVRGISPLASGVLVAHDLSEYMDAEIDASKLAAKYLAFVKTPDIASRQLALTKEEVSGKNQYIDTLENGIIEYLNPGEDITLASNPRPGSNFPPFVKLVLCMLSATTGVPYEMISKDYQGLNYSTARTVRNDFAKSLKPIVQRHVRQFCNPTFKAFMEHAVMSGILPYTLSDTRYLDCEWQSPGMDSVDPLKETKAWISAVEAQIRSPQDIIRASGRDPEAVLQEIQQWQKWREEYGIQDPVMPSTASANNPEAVEEQE